MALLYLESALEKSEEAYSDVFSCLAINYYAFTSSILRGQNGIVFGDWLLKRILQA